MGGSLTAVLGGTSVAAAEDAGSADAPDGGEAGAATAMSGARGAGTAARAAAPAICGRTESLAGLGSDGGIGAGSASAMLSATLMGDMTFVEVGCWTVSRCARPEPSTT